MRPKLQQYQSVAAEFRSLSDELDDLPPVVVHSRTEPQASLVRSSSTKRGQACILSSKACAGLSAQEHADPAESPTELATKVQRSVIKCGWHLSAANRTNIVVFVIYSCGDVKGRLSCVVLVEPGLEWLAQSSSGVLKA